MDGAAGFSFLRGRPGFCLVWAGSPGSESGSKVRLRFAMGGGEGRGRGDASCDPGIDQTSSTRRGECVSCPFCPGTWDYIDETYMQSFYPLKLAETFSFS